MYQFVNSNSPPPTRRERAFLFLARPSPKAGDQSPPSPSERPLPTEYCLLLTAKRAILLLLALLILPACRQPGLVDGAPDVQIVLTPGPDALIVGPIAFDLTLWDADGNPIDGAEPVIIRGDMSHAGMRPVIARAGGLGNGLYNTEFEWTMAGDWIVTVEATLPDGRVKRATFPFTVEELE